MAGSGLTPARIPYSELTWSGQRPPRLVATG
jgi:hypothetical protein